MDQRAVQKIVRRTEGRDDNPAAFGDRWDVPQRNLTRGQFAFRLPLSDRGFYPNFVARLKDGRIAIIEYKGAIYRTTTTQRKRN